MTDCRGSLGFSGGLGPGSGRKCPAADDGSAGNWRSHSSVPGTAHAAAPVSCACSPVVILDRSTLFAVKSIIFCWESKLPPPGTGMAAGKVPMAAGQDAFRVEEMEELCAAFRVQVWSPCARVISASLRDHQIEYSH